MNQVALLRDFEFRDNRLPYVPDLADAYGIDNVRWRVLIDTIYPNAKKIESIIMALTYCKARNLDIFKRPVHIVPMWSSAANAMIDTIWPGIAELRTTAFRTGQFAGMSASEFGPMIDGQFGEKKVRYPEWCQIVVTRVLNGVPCAFASPKVYWLESYAVEKRGSTVPNEMWARRPSGQLEKCTEGAALRRAFPEEIGNDLSAEEMEGQIIDAPTSRPAPKLPPAPPPIHAIASPVRTPPVPSEPAKAKTPPNPTAEPQSPSGPAFVLSALKESLDVAKSEDECNTAWDKIIDGSSIRLTDEQVDEAQEMLRHACSKFYEE